jgi:hypothetical protein
MGTVLVSVDVVSAWFVLATIRELRSWTRRKIQTELAAFPFVDS